MQWADEKLRSTRAAVVSAAVSGSDTGAPGSGSRARRWWRRYWWLALALVFTGAAVVAFAFTEGGLGTRIERTLLLLPVANRRDVVGLSLPVKVAYFVAAGVILFVTYRAALALFGVRLHEARAALLRNHTVVYGLGSQGRAVAESLLGSQRVVAVDQDPANPAIRGLRDRRAVVLVGDATDPDFVRRTGAHRARHVVVVCGEDAVNARVAATHAFSGRGKRDVDLFVHISDPRLYTFLVHHSFMSRAGPRLELFNSYERGARRLLEETLATSPPPGRVLVVGAGNLGLALVSQLARGAFERGSPERLRVDLVDREAQARSRLLEDRYGRLRDVCDVVPHALDVDSPAFDRLLHDGASPDDVDVAFVCFDNDTLTIASALSLLDQSAGRFPVVARVSEKSEGIAGMIESARTRYAEAEAFRPVILARRAVEGDLVLDGMRGQIARQIHETYREAYPGGPYDVPWSSLPPDGRERNVRHAESIAEQLEALGYRLGPLIDWGEPLPEFGADEVAQMSRTEHERWLAERRGTGWQYGPVRDERRRHHPDLVSWDELPDHRRDINRRLVRERPAMLARVGVQIYRA
jgi:hypothetical protein